MRSKKSLPLICAFISLVGVAFFVSNLVRLQTRLARVDPTTSEATFSLAPVRHVTKSMTELGRMDEVNRHFLFLNHVPKCGSEILILLLQRLQGYNNFRHVRLKWGNKRYLSRLQQEELVDEVYETMQKEAIPLSFDRHVYFVNFTTFDKQLPMYINLIRDPVEKIISRISFGNRTRDDFYYKCLTSKKNNCNFKNGKPYDLSIPYFCGHHPNCMLLNDDWAYREAKSNVKKYYPVVGVLEELNATLAVLEKKLPYFFKGTKKVFLRDFHKMYRINEMKNVPRSAREELRKTLIKELDFYHWIKSRLLKQYHSFN